MHGLLTDLYELTMAAGYHQAGKLAERATFELSIRRLPAHRGYLILAGLEQAVEYLTGLSFRADEISYLRGLPIFSGAPAAFFDYLAQFRFTGDVWAIPEGTVVFAGEPVLRVTAPLAEAQLPETYLLATITFQTLIATKAARLVSAAGGRPVIEFGTRRAHTPQAGALGARAAYIGGCAGTSNVDTGHRYGVPVYGTAAHSWTLAFDSEREAFGELERLLGERTVYLVDTYNTAAGLANAVAVGRPFWGVRLDSGDFDAESRRARTVLDRAGYHQAQIMASGDLNEYRIAELVAAGAPIEAFGVGTELATSGDTPSMGSIYKLVAIERQGEVAPVAKLSPEKPSLPGIKQVFRFQDRDVVGLAEEKFAGSTPLLEPVIHDGDRIASPASLEAARERARQGLAALPPECLRLENPAAGRVEHSAKLRALIEEVQRPR